MIEVLLLRQILHVLFVLYWSKLHTFLLKMYANRVTFLLWNMPAWNKRHLFEVIPFFLSTSDVCNKTVYIKMQPYVTSQENNFVVDLLQYLIFQSMFLYKLLICKFCLCFVDEVVDSSKNNSAKNYFVSSWWYANDSNER